MSAPSRLPRWLVLPATHGVDLDDPAMVVIRRQIIRSKPLLQDVYREWYDDLASVIPDGAGRVLELGAGAGFLRQRVGDVIASDIVAAPGLDVIADATALPFAAGALKAAVMTDVLHHVPQPRLLFSELARSVRRGGVVAMVEPWLSTWSRAIYSTLHHEPYLPETRSWEFESTGPLSGANLAMPWVIFKRDAAIFEREFPEWRVHAIRPTSSIRYIVSGGMSLRSLAPGASLPFWRRLDRVLGRWPDTWSMFAFIVLTRTSFHRGR